MSSTRIRTVTEASASFLLFPWEFKDIISGISSPESLWRVVSNVQHQRNSTNRVQGLGLSFCTGKYAFRPALGMIKLFLC